MADKTTIPKREPVTTTDLERVIRALPKATPVYIGQCPACEERILSFKGPRINCTTCMMEIDVEILYKTVKA